MSGLHGPVGKISRRLGVGVSSKGERILKKRPVPPGQHGASGRTRKLSVYGAQLLEKQKARAFYGLREKQFLRFFKLAQGMDGRTGDNLLTLLESRLDNVIYRVGLAVSRRQARQLVAHGHIDLNGRRTDIASCLVRTGDRISVRPTSRGRAYFQQWAAAAETATAAPPPDWLEQSGEDRMTWQVRFAPRVEHAEQQFNVQMIVEFYSR